MASLWASLLPSLHAARAGSYSGPAYSGGQLVQTLPNGQGFPPFPLPYGPVSGGGYGQNGGVPGSAVCSNAITTTFTWVPASGQTMTSDPPPTTIIVMESCTASASGMNGSGVYGSASCANGLNGPVINGSGTSSSSSTRYKTMSGGATVSLTCTPSASGTGNSGTSAYVSYTAAISPIFVIPGGAVKDSSGNYNILVGQRCTSSLTGIPSGCTASNYQWSVSGPTFQTWQSQTPAIGNNPFNPDASYEVDGPGPLTNPTAGWYWNERLTTPEVVSCSATVTPPAGQGAPFTVSATQPILVYRPNWTATGIGGYVKVSLLFGTIYEIMAGPTATELANGLKGGMNFTATVTSPNSTLFGNGSLELAQLCTPGRSFTSAQGDYTYSQNGQQGSDGDYPYGWNVNGPVYQTDDLPGNGLADYLMANFTMQDQFEDFLMYYAPGSVQAVPLAHFTWSTNGYAVLPHSGTWSTYVTQNGSDNAGTVSPSGNTATFLLSNTFPEWTQITGTGTFGITSPVGGGTFRRLSMNAVKDEHTPRGVQKHRGRWKKTMNKKLNEAAYSVSLHETENAQNQHPLGNTHFARRSGLGRRSATASKQQAKNQECYAIDVAGFDALHTGRYSEAELCARHVIALTHGYDPLAPELLAFALDAQDRTQEALDAYKVLADRGGDFPRIMLPYARLLLQTGQWAQAVVVYNKQLPNLSLGDLVRTNSHFSPATQRPEELATAIQIAQGLTYTAGEGWGLHSQDEEAMEHFQQAAALEPNSALANYYLGYGLKRLGRQAEAQAAFQKAAALDDGNIKAAALKEMPGAMQPH